MSDLRHISNKLDILLNQQSLMLRMLSSGNKQEEDLMLDISKLTNAISQQTSVDASVVALISHFTQELQQLAAQNSNGGISQSDVDALVAKLNGSSTQLAQAVAAGTAADPANQPAPETPTPAPSPDASGGTTSAPADGTGPQPTPMGTRR